MARFYNTWIFALMALLCSSSTEAYLCMCSPSSCVLIHPNADFFENVENYCSTFRSAAQDVSIIKIMDTKLSSTAFTKFPNMTSLEIFQGQLTRFDDNTFSNAGNLSKLLIRGNNIASLDNYAFKGADNLKDLMISANPLKVIAEYAFANLHDLENLILSHGELTTLPKYLFSNNRKLKILSMNNNKIGSIHPEMFEGLDALTKLELAENKLTTFDYKHLKAPFVLLNNNSLQHLVINEHYTTFHASHNDIETITVEGINVVKLGLVHNRIRDIRNLTKLVNLTSLSLGSNALEPSTVFSTLTNIQELMLQSTYIDITPQTFENLQNLRILDLSYNNLTAADFTVFRSQLSLQVLSYVGNRINSFNYLEAKEHLPQLRVLEICKNGWNSTYFAQNIARMKRFGISPDIHGFSTHFLFRDDYVNLCSEKLDDEYNYDDYSDSGFDVDVEDEIKQSYPKEEIPSTGTSLTTTSTMSTTSTSTVPSTETSLAGLPTSLGDTASVSTSTEEISKEHHVSEHETRVLSKSVPDTHVSEPKNPPSPLFILFQVVMYSLSVVGFVSLIVTAYLWRSRRLDMRRLTTNTETMEDVRLV